MQILQLLWKIIQTYISYRKNMKAIRTGKGVEKMQDAMMVAFRKGDYQAAFFKAVDPFFKGYLMMQMGQLGAAVPLITHAVQNAKDPRAGAIANSTMGQLLMEDRQYDRALESFRTSQILWQERGGADRFVAEMWLRRGGNAPEALRYARRGLERERAFAHFSDESKNSSLCEQIGTLAWAVAAESHDAAEVDSLAAEGMSLSSNLPVSTTALMHLHLGHAYAALGNAEQSARHFDEAARTDPNGLAGRAAIAMTTAVRR